MQNNIIPTNQALTDSFSLKIPLAYCEVIDLRLTSLTCLYYESIDAHDSQLNPPKPLIFEKNGVKVRFSLCEIQIHDKEQNIKIPTKFVNLTVSAKLLYSNYFQGITKDNIYQIFSEFIKYDVIKVSFEHFKQGIISDVDVCFNRYINNELQFIDSCETLMSQTGIKSKWLKITNEPTNKGISFNRRDFATPSIPFIKIYHKELELLNNSTIFWNNYLFEKYGDHIKGLTRFEATIRNYKHKERLKKYGILDSFRTLDDYLQLPQNDLMKFCIFSINGYIETKARVKAPDLSPTDHIIFELLQNCIIKGYDFKHLEAICETFKGSTSESTKVAKSRIKKKIKDLFDLIIHKDLKLQTQASHNKHVLSYLEFLNFKY